MSYHSPPLDTSVFVLVVLGIGVFAAFLRIPESAQIITVALGLVVVLGRQMGGRRGGRE